MVKRYKRPNLSVFFSEKVLNCAHQTLKPIGSDKDDNGNNNDNKDRPSSLKYNTVQGYKSALIDLYQQQIARNLHHYPHLNGSALRALMLNLSRRQAARKKKTYEDWRRGTIANDYDAEGLWDILAEFWRQSQLTKPQIVAATL